MKQVMCLLMAIFAMANAAPYPSNEELPPSCASTLCPVGTICKEVRCIRAPCPVQCVSALPPQGNCSQFETFVECGTCEPTCDNKNHVCTFDCKPPRCQCAQGFFRLGNKCVTENDCDSRQPRATPNPCTLPCPTGQVCIEEQVFCKKAPCRPRQTCVPEPDNAPTCEVTDCATGLVCVMKEVQCIRAPCSKIPHCVPPNSSS